MTTPDLEGLAREHEERAEVDERIAGMFLSNDPRAQHHRAKAQAHRQVATLIRSAPAPGREEIARIIDPSAWTTLDMLYAELVQRGGKPNPARFKDGWSLDKADAILALFHAPAEAGGGEAEKKLCPECQGTGLQRIEGLYDDCPKCDGDGLVSPSPTPPAEAGGGEDEGAVRTAGAKLLTALERYGFPVSDAASTAAMSVEARDLHNAARRFKIAITSIMRPADEPAVTNGQ